MWKHEDLTYGGKMDKNIKYLTIEQIVQSDHYPFSFGQMRSYLLDRKKNGLSKAVRKIGKRVYIRTDLFDEWIDSHEDFMEMREDDS